jgi:hypothetical protein
MTPSNPGSPLAKAVSKVTGAAGGVSDDTAVQPAVGAPQAAQPSPAAAQAPAPPAPRGNGAAPSAPPAASAAAAAAPRQAPTQVPSANPYSGVPAGNVPPAGAVPAAAGSLGTGTATAQRPAPAPAASASGRRVRLTVSRVDPWSVMKISFLISVAVGIAIVVMVAVLWLILDGMGVFSSVNGTIKDVAGDNSSFDLMDYIALPRVLSLAVVIGVIDVILMTALSTLAAFLYNVCSSLVGGVQLTLSDD